MPNAFIEFLKTNEVEEVWDFALMACSEALVDTKIIDAAGLSKARLMDRIAITKAWAVARAQYEKEYEPLFVTDKEALGAPPHSDVKALQAEIRRLQDVVKSLQSSKDKAVSELQRVCAKTAVAETSGSKCHKSDSESRKRTRQ